MDIIQIYKTFSTHELCIDYLEKLKWQGKPQCPYCNSLNHTPMPREMRYHCNICNTSYSVLVNTIFQDTKLELQKWFLGIALTTNVKTQISIRQLAKELNVNKNTASYMVIRIKNAAYNDPELIKKINEALALGE